MFARIGEIQLSFCLGNSWGKLRKIKNPSVRDIVLVASALLILIIRAILTLLSGRERQTKETQALVRCYDMICVFTYFVFAFKPFFFNFFFLYF